MLFFAWILILKIVTCEVLFTLNREGLDGSKVSFQSKTGSLPFSNYLQLSLNYTYFEPLFRELNKTEGVPALETRGEAHVTVISPVEYDEVLSKANVTMEEINQIALSYDIQGSSLSPACIGRDRKTIDKVQHEVYNIVLTANHDLVNIRRKIFVLYLSKDGEGSLFQPEAYWGHITLGFVHRDLFIEDGIFKGMNSCWGHLKLVSLEN